MQGRTELAQGVIRTQRLELVPATVATLAAELGIGGDLGRMLGVTVPRSWPPELQDEVAVEHALVRLSEGPHQNGWWSYYSLLVDPASKTRSLVGSAGYKGTPEDGIVEVECGTLPEHRRRGLASEALQALIGRAFEGHGVSSVVAETRRDRGPSIKLLEKLGFRFADEDKSRVRYELAREP